MELVGHNPTGLNTARYGLAGAGTQTAALAFGGIFLQLIQEQQKNTMVQLGHQSNSLIHGKKITRRSRNSNSSIRFWW
jgi:hypothetical protein